MRKRDADFNTNHSSFNKIIRISGEVVKAKNPFLMRGFDILKCCERAFNLKKRNNRIFGIFRRGVQIKQKKKNFWGKHRWEVVSKKDFCRENGGSNIQSKSGIET